jgi:aconitate hydratase
MNEELAATRTRLDSAGGRVEIYRLDRLAELGAGDVHTLPHTIKIILENLLRRSGTQDVSIEDVRTLAAWPAPSGNVAFMPTRVLMQDFTGVPAVVDLAAMRSAAERSGRDPASINPSIPVDLVVDHSVQVDLFRSKDAYEANIDWEYLRNGERYSLLKWAQQAFEGLRVVPPGAGICHQVNLEHLGQVVVAKEGVAFPDTVIGTDSHTTMINGLGVLGWGVGGIEAEAAMLGQPLFLSDPVVVGVHIRGSLPSGTTATDLVLTLTQMLRSHGVVGSFVEFFGDGLSTLPIADRATLSNMCPEYGATAAFFPIDELTLEYLRLTGRADRADLVDRYAKEQGLFRSDGVDAPRFSEVLELDLSSVEPSVAGPKRPQDRVRLADVWSSFLEAFHDGKEPDPDPGEVGRLLFEGGHVGSARRSEAMEKEHGSSQIGHGSVVIAAITSCTNTSNPSVMLGAGLLAKKAVEVGLEAKPWVKTSLAPGSRVVTDYLDRAGLAPYLEKLGFSLVGYGCTTCIGNSGPLPEAVAAAIDRDGLNVVAVLSGNRNFEGRIHPQVRASYLASPPLVVAYALAGDIRKDLASEPLGWGRDGLVYLRDIWPSPVEIENAVGTSITEEQFLREYGRIWDGDERWGALDTPSGSTYAWDPASTYVREPPFLQADGDLPGDIRGARILVKVGDSITTDHISPAGSIKPDSPAGRYLQDAGVRPSEFNSYGARRGNHEVMMRGTFANIRLRNELAPGTEGSWTTHLPSGEVMSVFDAALRYREQGTPLGVLAGKEYGSGSSRDWAAKGPALLGVRFVLAESFERIHRSNLVGMGIVPLQYFPGETSGSLDLNGRETFNIRGLADGLRPGGTATVEVQTDGGAGFSFHVEVKVAATSEVEILHAGGILPMVLRDIAGV